MKCVTPMFRKYVKGDHKKGTVISRSEARKELEINENINSFRINEYNQKSPYYNYELIPCKKCWACQLNYSAEWATRIMLESKKYDNNWFITLTYTDEYIPILQSITGKYKISEDKTEEITYINDGTWTYSLYPEHVNTFINSLRKDFERREYTGIKYFYCGEYGENTQRPHYHMILMNCPLDIFQFYNTHIDKNFKAHWKSHELEKWWKYGFIDIAELEWSCAAYVARYCTKKLSNKYDNWYYMENGKWPEFIRMSQGIGFDYYEKHKKEIYKNDEMIMKTVKRNTGSFKPPKAFDRKFKEEFPKEWEMIKKSREKAAERTRKLIESLTDYTDKQILNIEAEKVINKMSMLPRQGQEGEL